MVSTTSKANNNRQRARPLLSASSSYAWVTSVLLVAMVAMPPLVAALEERRVLAEFFEATNGAQWLNKENWGSDAPICSWHGVSCLGGSETEDSEVDTVQLPNNNIAGAIPASLYSMPLLRFLDLEGNPLTNAGFAGFQEAAEGQGVSVSPLETLALNGCNLRDVVGIEHAPTSLRDLRLADNNLKGDFPEGIFQVTSLRRLFLDHNGITGTIPSTVGNMQNLIDFHAIGVPFKGQIPSEFGLMNRMVTMVLRDNDFAGTIPTELNNMVNLEILSIGRSPEAGQGELSGPLPSFAQLPYLELLDFSLNKINGTIPRDFFLNNQRTDDLVIVRLDGNELTGTLPKQLGWIDSMDLGLTGNKLIGPIPAEICEKKQWMTGLVEQFACDAILCPAGTYAAEGKQTLTAECAPCDDSGASSSQYLGQTSCGGGTSSSSLSQPWQILAELYMALQGQSWSNRDGWSAIETVLKNKKLEDLLSTDLDYCSFFGVTCATTGEIKKIELIDNSLYGVIPSSVFTLSTMTTFDVASNRVSMDQEAFEKITNTNGLGRLVLSHTDVNTLNGLKDATALQYLYLDGVAFVDKSLPTSLFTLTNLRVLEIPNSQLRGAIPTGIGKLHKLKRLELRWNQLTGALPSEMGLLSNLEELDLSYNDFSGNLPSEIGLLSSLKELELSRARRGGLGGQLPSLDGLAALEVLGLSYNNFKQSIPASFLNGVLDKTKNMKVSLSYNHLTGVVPHQLDVFSSMLLELEGNMIEDLPSVFCDNTFWMEGYVQQATFGCNAILCPPGTWNKNGKESKMSLCLPCESNDVYGATDCGSSTTDADSPTATAAPGSAPSPQLNASITDVEILDMLFAATNGNEWTATHDGWSSGSPVCTREGVSCNQDGQIDALRLNTFGMNGRIPTEIFQLSSNRILGFTDNSVDLRFDGIDQSTSLETLLMSNTKLKSLEGLQRSPLSLKTLHLARNDLDGTFPKHLFSLQGLQKLFLNNNKLNGPIPTDISSMSMLKELHLWDNRLTGHLPSELGMLGGLQDFDVKSNLLSGPIPKEMGNMSAILILDLSDQRGSDKLSGPLYPFASNSLLHKLNVSMNAFAGTVPANMLAAVDKTKEVNLDLSSNKLSGEVPSQLNVFEKLNLFLAGNMISSLPSSLCAMASWMNGDVGTLNTCDAILCPPGTFSESGRANSTSDCTPCTAGATATYYGSTSCSNSAQASERDILTNFYQALNGDTWLSSFNWASDSGVCTWFGVTCNDDLSVIELKLASNQVVSTKDQLDSLAQIFQLPNLQVLDLKGNSVYLDFQQITFSPSLQSMRVSGTGLSSLAGISRATNLRRLHATDNLLNGTMPDELFDLPNMRSLYLSFNSIQGTIPSKISQLTNLQEFYMYGNQLKKSLPTEIGLLQNLKEVVLARNYLTGSIPTEFSSMSNLEQLSLYDQQGANKITGKVPTFLQSQNLWFFDISNCDLTGTIPSNFMADSVHKNATITLVLKNNEIAGTIPSSLKSFDSLDIDLSGNKIESISNDLCAKSGWMKGNVEIIGSCDSILCPQGSYSENGRQEAAESPCQSCQDLKNVPYLGQTKCQSFEGERGALSLLYSTAGGSTWKSKSKWASDSPICSWEGIECSNGSAEDDEGVTAIKLEKNSLAGSLPTALWSLPSLQTLLLSGNEGLAISLDGLSNAAEKLEVLQISNTKIDSIDGIAQASSLKELYLDENGLTGTFPLEIFDLHSSLEKLRFSANFFYGSLPTEITKMTKLTEFHAANNEFYSTIPSELAQLEKLQSLALNENLFYGDLPTEISSMPQLQIFSVRRERKSGPKLTGKVPTFANNPSLTVLFLDGNDFTGTIPSDFLASSSAVYLVDLKNNSITGSVPEALDNLNELDIRMEGNQIDGLSNAFCDNADWMGGNVGRLKSCDAIMCGPGTANPNGRALSSPDECQACPDPKAAPFYGSRTCEPVLTEKEILVKLYDSCNGGEWKASTNWNTNAEICDWHGIGCKDGHVILINLGSNNLSGTPPAELFDLPMLEILWLNSNPLEFSFAHIGRATSLMDLRVDETSLASLAGVGAGVYLTSLHIGFNAIGGPFPVELLQLKNIRTLSMNNNGFSGPIPDLSDLEFLRTLRLGDNKFSESVPAFDGMHILSTIDISGNELSGPIPSNFLDRLGRRMSIDVDLSNNKITGTIPGNLARFDDLSLYVRGNKIEVIPTVLCSKPSWMGGDVGKFGCDAILCGPGTSNFDGRHSERSQGCATCSEAGDDFYGQAACLSATLGRSAADRTSTGVSFVFGIFLAFAGIVNVF